VETAQAGLIRVLRETGAYMEAARRCDQFLSARGNSALLHLERGRVAEALGDYAGAEKHLGRSASLSSDGAETLGNALRELAELLETVGRRDEARRLWDQLIQEYQSGRISGSRGLGNAAVAAWRRGYVEDARDIFLDATNPKTAGETALETLSDFGYLFLDKYNATEALSAFRDSLKINPSFPDSLVGVALAKRYENNLEVEMYSRAALKVNPNLVPALNLLAELALEEEDLDAAIEEIHAALAVNPASLDTLSLQAVHKYFSGDIPGFSRIEKQILGINPSCGKFYYILAESLVSRGKYQEAVEFGRKAVALEPELWQAYTSLGMNLTRVGKLEEGRSAIQRAFDGDPYNVWAFNSLELFDQMDGFGRRQSEHFVFRMSREDEPVLSPYAPALAEEAYGKLTERYGFKPAGPVQVEIFPDHGGFAVRTLGLPGLEGALGVCFGKVLAIDSPQARKAGAFNWGSTLWHELAHVITLQMTNHNIPRWYSEGLSVYEESRGRPGWGDKLTASFVKAYKEGRLLKVSRLNAGFTRPQSPEQVALSYYQAGLACEMIVEKFGFGKIRETLRLFSENTPSEEVFRVALGWDAARMDAEYAQFLDTRLNGIASHLRFESPAKGSGKAPPELADKSGPARALESDPDDFFANLQLGVALRREGQNAAAEVHLRKAQKMFPQYTEPGNPYQILGQMFLELKRDEDALAEFTAWSRMDGNALVPLLQAAEILRKLKNWASAVEALELAVFINPYDPDIQKKLAEAAMESRQYPAAIAACRALVALNASDAAGAHYELARALRVSGDRREARREVLRALEIAPSFIKAQELLLELSEEQIK
jgi:tetratricopeptide (TPR) repeat protein